MAAKKKKTKSKKAKQTTQSGTNEGSQTTTSVSANGQDLIHISPSRVRFQHSKIRPVFSGCGRSVTETLDEIRRGNLEPGDLPPIQVLIGPNENDGLGPWYFSLNNRRLWVLKQCHKDGLLDNERYNNKIPVRVRIPKSQAESERYTAANCALEAKFMREGGGSGTGGGGGGKGKKKKGNNNKKKGRDCDSDEGGDGYLNDGTEEKTNNGIEDAIERDEGVEQSNEDDIIRKVENNASDDSESSESDDDDIASDNPFSALF